MHVLVKMGICCTAAYLSLNTIMAFMGLIDPSICENRTATAQHANQLLHGQFVGCAMADLAGEVL